MSDDVRFKDDLYTTNLITGTGTLRSNVRMRNETTVEVRYPL